MDELIAQNQFVHSQHSWLLRLEKILSTLGRELVVRTSLSCKYHPRAPFHFWAMYAVW